MDNHVAGLAGAFIFLGIVVAAIFICREVACWYWKINRLVERSEQQILELVAIKGLLHNLVNQRNESAGENGLPEQGKIPGQSA